ncbi:hypothetical protein D3C77_586060 [compost metagenome]
MYELTHLRPWDIVLKNTEEIRVATSDDLSKIVIYIPVNTILKLNADLSEYNFTLIDLEHRKIAGVVATVKDNTTVLGMHNFTRDVLLIGEKNT